MSVLPAPTDPLTDSNAPDPEDESRTVPPSESRNRLRFMSDVANVAVAVIVAYLGGKLGDLTLWGSIIYVVARALYVPIYAAGIPMVRSLVWFAAMIGLGMVVAAIFL